MWSLSISGKYHIDKLSVLVLVSWTKLWMAGTLLALYVLRLVEKKLKEKKNAVISYDLSFVKIIQLKLNTTKNCVLKHRAVFGICKYLWRLIILFKNIFLQARSWFDISWSDDIKWFETERRAYINIDTTKLSNSKREERGIHSDLFSNQLHSKINC